MVVDLVTTVRPGTSGYPFNAARDALQDHARWAFRDLVDQVERENESVGRDQEDEVFDPDSDDADERRGAEELADLAAEAFADPAFQQALAEAAGGIADFYAERAKDPGVEVPVASLAPAGSRAPRAGDGPTRGAVLPPGLGLPPVPVEPDLSAPTRELRVVLSSAEEAQDPADGRQIVLTPEVRAALDQADAGTLDGDGARVLSGAIDRAADAALGPGGGGVLQVVAITARGHAALDLALPAGASRPVRGSPFGRLAGLRISKKNYPRPRAWRFRRNFQRWMPHLTAWDATLRLVATEARIRRRFKPGFVLDDEMLGLTTSTPGGATVIYIHPDRFEQVVKAHRERPLAIAAYLHGVACHELTHADGRMGRGHGEEFVSAREDLGHATGHLLPAIAVLVQKVLGLPVKATDDQKRIGVLERQLTRAREARKDGQRSAAQVARLQRELDEARVELAEAEVESARVRAECGERCGTCACAVADEPAVRVVDAAVGALLARPPVGVEAAEVASFARRHRERLVGMVRARMGEMPNGIIVALGKEPVKEEAAQVYLAT